ncbi:adenosylcobinamide amidohydrolase [Methylopila jiangsuensis]|uniref:Adenosylcobinamide amidohydrolase n=1 Tax=Methylopila jiangsuensis TaxID=586230 RepID=A0A9W6JL26_9HYPH|nr:adenosylcobinamide amidohydrolase [Methylopila jiangsuensis]MDR6284814.1 adenosylcobinamide amidohydrolase [Methylopila jiangsuensis]GLK77795.1 adenosylcobinamide amidohydrolase [Methylopila jiangsuensis]
MAEAGAPVCDDAGELFALRCAPPWLTLDFPTPQSFLSWAPARPGFQTGTRVAWLEVRNADLPPEVDPLALLAARLQAEGLSEAVAMMTSRDIACWRRAAVRFGAVTADCVATVGLGNAVHVGRAAGGRASGYGTINLLAAVSAPLSPAARIEALSIASEARTAAVMEAGWRLPTGLATGTGTDCVVVAAPDRPEGEESFAGLHTEVGQALGAAVHAAVLKGARDWIAERGDRGVPTTPW